MDDMPRIDRAELDADREVLASLPGGVACGLPVDRVRRYLDALAAVVPAPAVRPASHKTPPRWETVFREPGALARLGIELPPPGPMPVPPLAPVQRLRPWRLRELARAPSRGTIVFIIIGVAVLLATSAWQDGVLKSIGEGVVVALVGARALGISLDQQVRKRGDDELDDGACDEPAPSLDSC